MRLYTLVYARFGELSYRRSFEDIHRYVTTFLAAPEGAFYVSQDADLIKGQHSADYFSLDDRATPCTAGRRARPRRPVPRRHVGDGP